MLVDRTGIAIAAAALFAVAAMNSCGGNRCEQMAVPTKADAPQVGWQEFAPPSDLLRTASYEDADRFRLGEDFDPELPNNRVLADSDCCRFTPAWSPGSGEVEPAYAMYSFSLAGYYHPAQVQFGWQVAPLNTFDFYVALGDPERNCWIWHQGPPQGSPLVVDLCRHVDEQGRLLLLVLITGTADCKLEWLCCGDGAPPVARLIADPLCGSVPLQVFFDASGSQDYDGAIANYEWDFDGNGEYSEVGEEATAKGASTASCIYSVPGTYSATVRVTDDRDLASTAVWLVTVKTAENWVIVTFPWTIPQWQEPVFYTSLAVIDGSPAIAYAFDGGLIDVMYTRACTATGVNVNDWSDPVKVGTANDNSLEAPLVEVDGHPAICYQDKYEDLIYVRSTTSDGTAASDWSQIVTVDNETYSCGTGAMAVVASNPAIVYPIQTVENCGLAYVRANTTTGGSVADWGLPVPLETGTT